ncbi:MAG: Type secretory pathway VirD2 pilin (relaxase)-like protein [Bryobacterales bacterium]|nr:Type secretory pathway VirD2 pilin (relaxase)-like protein [Bryobacterales bacterium]
MYTANKTAGQWKAHGRYISRESANGGTLGQVMSTGTAERTVPLEPAKELERWQSEGDPRLWKLIVSPEFGERLDLDQLTRELMERMEKDLGTKLEWVAVTHFNTEHPHVHIALRGIRDDKSALDLPRDYVRHGIRAIAEDLCTRQLGHRNHLDAEASERREIQERRFTTLDRAINRANLVEVADSDSAEHFVIQRTGGKASRAREQHVDARLLVLQQMGLAELIAPQEWKVRRDFETVLKAMQRTSDRQKMLASHGALLSDERLPLVVLDLRKLKILEGRVLAHSEEEVGKAAGRHYLLLEGTDAVVHLIYYTPEMEEARSSGKLRANSFVRLQKQFENGRPVLDIEDSGDAEAVLRNKRHLGDKAKLFLDRGVVPPDDGWGGWLGRYQAAVNRTAPELTKLQIDRRSGFSR